MIVSMNIIFAHILIEFAKGLQAFANMHAL